MDALAARLSVWLTLPARVLASRGRHRQEGQGMVEYALILMLMALVVIVVLGVVGTVTKNVFSNVSTQIAV